jgi:hypothetical protein
MESILTFFITAKQLDPTIILTIEEAGYPQYALSLLTAYALKENRLSDLLSNIDLFNMMVYSASSGGQDAKYYAVNDWEKDCTNWCPLGTQLPAEKIVLGMPGCCSQSLTEGTVKNFMNTGHAGTMVWYIPSDSDPKIAYQGTCESSGGCGMVRYSHMQLFFIILCAESGYLFSHSLFCSFTCVCVVQQLKPPS